jgi:hypothetical protein
MKGVYHMAVNSTIVDSALVIQFKTGIDAKGNDIVKNQRFNSLKVDSTDEDAYAVGAAIGGLLTFPLVDVQRENDTLLTAE